MRPSPLGVACDVDLLRSVLVHRPGAELAAAIADPAAMLFAEPPDLGAVQSEHDAMVAVLREAGAEVLTLEGALTELLATEAGRSALATDRRLAHLNDAELARALIDGLVDGEAVLAPLPNLLYTRDTSTWIGRRPVIGTMATEMRARETHLVRALYALHPRFAGAEADPLGEAAPRVEGGDVLVAAPGRVMVGVSDRTRRGAAQRYAGALLDAGVAEAVLLVDVPGWAAFHLDLVVTLVDHDKLAVWSPLVAGLRGEGHTRGASPTEVDDVAHWIVPDGRIVPVGDRSPPRHGWDRGVNVLALAPGRVVAHAGNRRVNEQLTAAGVEVIEVPGEALAAGRGGPHCLTCPFARGR